MARYSWRFARNGLLLSADLPELLPARVHGLVGVLELPADPVRLLHVPLLLVLQPLGRVVHRPAQSGRVVLASLSLFFSLRETNVVPTGFFSYLRA